MVSTYGMRYNLENRGDPVLLDLQKFIEDISIKCVCVYENPRSANPHVHIFFSSELSDKTLRNKITYRFNKEKVQNRYQLKSYSDPNPTYLFKGPYAISKLKDSDYPGEKREPDVVFNNFDEYTKEAIDAYHEEWWIKARELKIGKFEKEDKVPELQSMYNYIVERRTKGVIDGKFPIDYGEIELIDDVIYYYYVNKKMIRYSMLSEYVDSLKLLIWGKYKRKEDLETVIVSIRNKLLEYNNKKF